jgi:uncharacterized membrane protein YcaP (DUF421 family)
VAFINLFSFDSSEVLRVLITSVVSIVVMYLLTKLMGEKQIHHLNMFDYMTGITIGSIAAELATDLENPVQPLTAMLVYGLAALLVSYMTMKSVKLRKIINGRSVVLMDGGKLYRANLASSHLELSEFIAMCREQGYFDISQIETAILEHTGSLSILPKSKYRPYTPEDAGISPQPERPKINVIMDGKIMPDKLRLAGVDKRWLAGELKAQGGIKPEDIALACVDENKHLLVFPVIREKNDVEWFE